MSSRSSSASSSSSSSGDNSDTEMAGNKDKKSSGSDRSRSPSRSGSEKSRASSRSKSPEKASSVRTRSSSSGSSSPRFVSATSSDASGSKKSDASSTTSSKGKRKLKAKDRKVSNKMAEKLKKSDESEDEESHNSSEDERRKKSSKAPAKKSTPAKGRKGKKDQSEEEGEIASDDKEFDDGLDEDLIGDDEDRARLEDMTEREREEELFKRAENRENLRKRFEIQKKLKQQQKLKNEEKKEKKPTSDESEEEEGQRSDSGSDSDKGKSQAKKGSDESGDENYGMGGYGTIQDAKERSQDRRKNLDAMKYDKKSSALSELKAKRQERERRDMERAKKEKEKSRDDDSGSESPEKSSDGRKTIRSDRDRKKSKKTSKRRSRSRSSSSSSGPAQRRARSSSSSSSKSSKSSRSGSSSGSASDTERFHKSPSRQTQKYIETQEDLEPIRLSRFKLEKFVHLPFFKKLVNGCFVRIGIGSFEGRSVYRAAEVADVVETAKVYAVGKARTNLGLKLRFGKQERVFRLEFISNSPITPQEFEKWRQTCQEAAITFPTLEFVKSKSAEIKKALSYEFSSDDVDKVVAAKEKFNKHPVNYAMHKARLMKERDAALTTGDEARAREFDVKLSEIEERAEELDRKRTSTISAVSLINDRNRKANVSKAEVAIMREIRKRKLHGFESNPFTRRKCNPRIVTKNVGGDDPTLLAGVVSGSAEHKENQVKVAADAKRKADTAAADEAAAKKKKTAADAAAQLKKEDLFDAHDFDIEIDVDTTVAGPVNASKPLLSTGIGLGKDGLGSGLASRPTKRSLNLDDYKKKRGLI